MNSLRNCLAFLGIVIAGFQTHAQSSAWNIDAGRFQYSMTIVAFLSVDKNTLVDEQDKVAAFANGEIRGVANPIYVASADRYLAYLTVFANKEGETIDFKIYERSSGKIVDAATTVSFKIDGQRGNVFQAFSIANPELSKEAEIKNFYFTDVDSVSTIIAEGSVDVVVEYDEDLTILVPQFSISDGAKVYLNRAVQVSGEQPYDFSTPLTYSVLSEDESVLNAYVVTVTNREAGANGFVCSNVVTANNDGSNDYWIVQDLFKYDDHEFRILDANGRLIFESTGYKNEWNATFKGSKLSRGKYFFVIRDPETNKIITGDILVVY